MVNQHNAGKNITREQAENIGYDVRYVETHDRHRLFQAFKPDGSLVGDGTSDDNYNGFFIEADALHFLANDADFQTALTAAGGITDGGPESEIVHNTTTDVSRIDVTPTSGENLKNP